MALDKNDQMSGGKTAAGAKAAAASAKTGGAGSGNKSSGGGKMGSGSSQTGGAKASSSGGKMGANSSQTGGTKSGGTSKGSMGVASGKMGATSTQKSGGGGLQGVAAQSKALADRANAVSRGPGLLGSMASSKPAHQNRALTSIGLSLGERYGLSGNKGIAAAKEMAKTLAGEVGKFGQRDYDAAARTMTNRMDMMGAGYSGFGKTVRDMLGAYDANRYTSRTQVPQTLGAYSAYQAAKPGTTSFNKGMTALANAMSPYSEIEKSPVARATHYYSGPRTNAYQKGFQQYGPHKFGTPDVPSSMVATAQQRALQAPSTISQMASLPSEPSNPWEQAQQIPTPREQTTGYLGGIVGNMPSPSSFPGRPMEMAGGFPAASRPSSSFPGRPEYAGAFPAEDRQPSSFPGRPSAPQGFGSSIAGRPEASPQFASMVTGRPEFPGQLPAAGAMSSFPGRPEFPGAFPAEDRQPSTFAGRPEFRGPGFPAAQQMASTFPGRPETVGPGFPAAAPPRQNPARSFAGIPGSGFPQAPPQQGGGFFAGLADAATPSPQNPPRSFANIPQGGLYAAQDDGSFINRMMGATGVPAPGNDLRDVQGGQTPLEWTGSEPPQVVAQMQQHVEEVLRQYLGTAPAGVA